MRIKYNSPVVITFSIIATVVMILDTIFMGALQNYFSVPGQGGFNALNILDYPRLVLYTVGHANWPHLLGNLSFLLLIGPILEERHGSGKLLLWMVLTALVTGIINILVFPAGIHGASGIVFMMILLVSFTNIKDGEIPLTFFLVVALFLTKEIINSFQSNNISEFAHIAGGVCGSIFGFIGGRNSKPGGSSPIV